jgi:PAS domain S-box-containing protein
MIIEGEPKGRVWSFHNITKRMTALKALHESEAIYRNLVLKLPDGLYKSTHEGKFIDVNPAMVSMLGYVSKEELMSLDIKSQLYFEPQDRESKALDDNLEEVGVYRLKKKDGSAIWVEDKGWYNLDEKGNIVSHEGIMRDITQRKRAEELLLDSEERYRTIVDNIGEGVGLVNAKDQFEFANIAAEKIFGVGPGGLAGMDLNQFVSQDQYELVQKQTSLRKNGIKSVYELDIQRPNKDVRTIIVTAVPLIDTEKGFVDTYGVFRDITERKQAEKALRYEQYLLHTLMNNVPDHIYFKDCQSRFIRINNAQAQLFGLRDPEQAVGKTDFDFFTVEHARQAYDDEQEIIRTGKPISKEERETWEDLSDTWVLTTKMPLIDKDDKIIGTFGISMNIDQRKKTEAEIQLKNEELHRINAEKDKFFSIIAHDLRSPFNGFLGLTEIMAEELSTMTMEDIKKFVLIIRTSAINLYSLLGNLLEWSSMQRSLTTYFPTRFLLMSNISESMVFVMEGASNKKIEIRCDIPIDMEVYADRNMLGGIIRNLVSNAIKFTPRGGRIVISAKCGSDKSVEVSIEDSGIGMNENMIGHLFNLDVNTGRNGTDGEHSTGLGLVLCKDFVEKHGGKLWVKSMEGKGSTFSFTLPAKK